MMTDEGFVILAGSTGPVSTTTSFDEGKLALRQKLIERGVIEVEGEFLRFTEDLLMGTPSERPTSLQGEAPTVGPNGKTTVG